MDESSERRGINRRTLLKATAAAARLASNAPYDAQAAEEPVVETVSGAVQGKSLNGVMRFLGIPYAQSIAGPNRFAPPRPVKPWTGVREAVRYAESSPQQKEAFSSPVTPAFTPADYVVRALHGPGHGRSTPRQALETGRARLRRRLPNRRFDHVALVGTMTAALSSDLWGWRGNGIAEGTAVAPGVSGYHTQNLP